MGNRRVGNVGIESESLISNKRTKWREWKHSSMGGDDGLRKLSTPTTVK